MSDYIRFLCPKCGQRLKAKRETIGRQAHCGKCGARFPVPEPSTLDPPTPSTPEAPVAAAETDPAPMVLKDQTVDNYEVLPLDPRASRSITARKGCGRTLGLAGIIFIAGCSSAFAAIRLLSFSIGGDGPGTTTVP